MNNVVITGTMKIKIMFFATLRDYVGSKTVEMEIPLNTTVAGLKESVVREYPKMMQARNTMMTAINREFASDEQIIPLDAEIALFPPVSGG